VADSGSPLLFYSSVRTLKRLRPCLTVWSPKCGLHTFHIHTTQPSIYTQPLFGTVRKSWKFTTIPGAQHEC